MKAGSLAGFVVAVVLGVSLGVSPATAQQGPRITVVPASSSVGSPLEVRLNFFQAGIVHVGICGNGGLRGSPDCDQASVQSLQLPDTGDGVVVLTVVAPPVPCPCVVRVARSDSSDVQTAPVDLPGLPVAPLVPGVAANLPSTTDLLVDATVVDAADQTLGARAAAGVGGSSPRVLELTLHNTSDAPLSGLRVRGAVGRSAGTGSELTGSTIASIAPRETAHVSVPLTLDAPAVGTYHVSGRVDGLGAPLRFDATTTNRPWLLMVGVVLLVVGLVLRAVRRRRRRRRGTIESSSGAADPDATTQDDGVPDPEPPAAMGTDPDADDRSGVPGAEPTILADR